MDPNNNKSTKFSDCLFQEASNMASQENGDSRLSRSHKAAQYPNLTQFEERIGFIGLKNMGSRMVDSLIKAGYEVAVHDIIVLSPLFELTLNPQAAAEAVKVLLTSLAKIESIWLQEKGQFLLGSGQPSIADLSLACEIMQLEVFDHDCSGD